MLSFTSSTERHAEKLLGSQLPLAKQPLYASNWAIQFSISNSYLALRKIWTKFSSASYLSFCFNSLTNFTCTLSNSGQSNGSPNSKNLQVPKHKSSKLLHKERKSHFYWFFTAIINKKFDIQDATTNEAISLARF